MTLEASEKKPKVRAEGPFLVDLISKTYYHVDDIRKVTVKRNYIRIWIVNCQEHYHADLNNVTQEDFFQCYNAARCNAKN